MSLINKALKEEQRRRSGPAAAINAPMVSMAARRQNERGPMLLVGFTLAGMLLAGAVTCIFYFGSNFLDSVNGGDSITMASASNQPEEAITPHKKTETHAATTASASPAANLLDQLSTEDITAVQQMLLERAAVRDNTPATATNSTPAKPEVEPALSVEQRIELQKTVDQFSIQGIRKSGKNTRVFMNGRIQKIGDTVDLATGLKLVGFTESELIFSDTSGNRYNKVL